MKIRRILATAVAAAVTTPVVLLSAAPAFADNKPAAPAQTQDEKPSIEQLKLAVAAAQKAYDAAVAAEDAAQVEIEKTLDALDKADHPLRVAIAEAKKAAEAAATAKTEADTKLAEAEAALAALPEGSDKTEAEKAVAEAKKAAEAAATAKTAADAKSAEAGTALSDARVAAFKKLGVAQKAEKDARKALDAAKKALADAEAEEPGEECKDVSKTLTLDLSGPKKAVAGKSTDFTLRINNGTGTQLDDAGAFTAVINTATGDNLDKWTDLKWSVDGSTWNDSVENIAFIEVGTIKPGAKVDVKLRLAVDAKAPKAFVSLISATGYDNNDGSCGWGDEDETFDFEIAKAGTPATGGNGNGSTGGNTNTTGQGNTSTTAVNGGTTGSTTGSLAKTGSNDAVPQIALAGAAAVALGAGAMFVVRRRKAGADA
ncbi:LPXTG cell wall anchor domain-containing protein [Streptomyces sp. NPDC047971]|uniref:LPXTG cell wall anchor domain-containing protein n=1 Tax=Streptomyces sp. NPDC047971 TaxID=3154499 RepID=UPI0033E86D66